MSAPRVNIYGFPHKGLRNALSQLLFEVSKLDVTSEYDVAKFKGFAENVVLLLDLHQASEDAVVLKAIEARVSGSTAHNSAEHDRLHALLTPFVDQLRQLDAGASPGFSTEMLNSLCAFMSDYLTHMTDEEVEMNAVIWEHFDDSDIMSWHAQIMEKLTPDQKMLWFRFIVPALNPFERQIMMGGVRASVPDAVYQGILEMLGQYMSEAELAPLAA